MSNAANALRNRFERRSRQLYATQTVRESLVSVAGLVGRPVRATTPGRGWGGWST